MTAAEVSQREAPVAAPVRLPWPVLAAAFGCDTVQGYLLSRPVPPEDFRQWVLRSGRGPAAAVSPLSVAAG